MSEVGWLVGRLVCPSLTLSDFHSLTVREWKSEKSEKSERLVTYETFDQSDEAKWAKSGAVLHLHLGWYYLNNQPTQRTGQNRNIHILVHINYKDHIPRLRVGVFGWLGTGQPAMSSESLGPPRSLSMWADCVQNLGWSDYSWSTYKRQMEILVLFNLGLAHMAAPLLLHLPLVQAMESLPLLQESGPCHLALFACVTRIRKSKTFQPANSHSPQKPWRWRGSCHWWWGNLLGQRQTTANKSDFRFEQIHRLQ